MTKFTVPNTLFKTSEPRAETFLEETTRAAKKILAAEAAQRQVKAAHLRKARLMKEAAVSEASTKAKPKGSGKKPGPGPPKRASKRGMPNTVDDPTTRGISITPNERLPVASS